MQSSSLISFSAPSSKGMWYPLAVRAIHLDIPQAARSTADAPAIAPRRSPPSFYTWYQVPPWALPYEGTIVPQKVVGTRGEVAVADQDLRMIGSVQFSPPARS